MRDNYSTLTTGFTGIAGSVLAVINSSLEVFQYIAVVAGIVVSVLMCIKLGMEILSIFSLKKNKKK